MGTRGEAVLTCTYLCFYVLSKNKKNIKRNLSKIFNFYNLRKVSILYERVFVMVSGNM